MSSPQPLQGTNAVKEIRDRSDALLTKCRKRGRASLADVEQLVNAIHALADDSTHWYTKADYFRESYRLVKGITDDELDAQIAIEEATRPHLSPCRFPSSPDCTCSSQDGAS